MISGIPNIQLKCRLGGNFMTNSVSNEYVIFLSTFKGPFCILTTLYMDRDLVTLSNSEYYYMYL